MDEQVKRNTTVDGRQNVSSERITQAILFLRFIATSPRLLVKPGNSNYDYYLGLFHWQWTWQAYHVTLIRFREDCCYFELSVLDLNGLL